MSQLQKTVTGLSPSLDTEVGRVIVDSGLATETEVELLPRAAEVLLRPQPAQHRRPARRALVHHPTQAKRIKAQLEERETSQIPGYQLICRVGKGAMATVYKARQVSLDRIVAIKVLPRA